MLTAPGLPGRTPSYLADFQYGMGGLTAPPPPVCPKQTILEVKPLRGGNTFFNRHDVFLNIVNSFHSVMVWLALPKIPASISPLLWISGDVKSQGFQKGPFPKI